MPFSSKGDKDLTLSKGYIFERHFLKIVSHGKWASFSPNLSIKLGQKRKYTKYTF